MKLLVEIENNQNKQTYHLHLTKKLVQDRARLVQALLNEFGVFQKLKIVENNKVVFNLG